MKYLFILLIIASGCHSEKSRRVFDCSNVNLIKHTIFPKYNITIGFPSSWSTVDSFDYLKNKNLLYAEVIRSKDDSSNVFYSVSDYQVNEIRKNDITTLTEIINSQIKSFKNGQDSLIERKSMQINGWNIIAVKSFIKKTLFTVVGQIICAKSNKEIIVYFESRESTFNDSNEVADCILSSFSVADSIVSQ